MTLAQVLVQAGVVALFSLSLRPAALSSFAAPFVPKPEVGRSWVTTCYKQRGVPIVLTQEPRTQRVLCMQMWGVDLEGSHTTHSVSVGKDGLSQPK